MKRTAVRLVAFWLTITLICSAGLAFAGGSCQPTAEGAPKEGVFYLAKTTGEQNLALSPQYLRQYGTRLFLTDAKDKTKFTMSLVDGETAVHASLHKENYVVITDARYAKGALVKPVLDETGKVVSVTVFTNKTKQELFAPAPTWRG
jgi:hypothetical protein